MIRDLKVSPSFALLDAFFDKGYSERGDEVEYEFKDVVNELDIPLKHKLLNKQNKIVKCDFLLRQLEMTNTNYKYGGELQIKNELKKN